MIKIFKNELNDEKVQKINKIEDNCWINLIKPTIEEIKLVVDKLGIEEDLITKVLDEEELPRIEKTDNATLIVVANGKKLLGAILQGVVALVWIFGTAIVIVNINKDIFKIVVFVVGSIFGSYLGSVMEEKIAMGSNMLICVVKECYEDIIKNKLKNYKITTICEKDKSFSILLIILKRKEISKISNIIKSIDKDSLIINEKAKTINNIV